MRRGTFRALLTGDSEQPELSAWLDTDSIGVVDVLKAPHHGSRNGLTPAWLTRTRPKVVVISVGAHNQYGHPDPGALATYESDGRRVFRTDNDGDVVVTVAPDGRFEVSTERQSATVPSAPAPPPAPVAKPPFRVESVSVAVPDSAHVACCRICVRGKACGNACISRSYECHRPPGCACDARPPE